MEKKYLTIGLFVCTMVFFCVPTHAQNKADKEKIANDRARAERDKAANARDRGDVKGAEKAADRAEKAAKETSNKDAKQDAREARDAAIEAKEKHGKNN
jgi:hypothetical protein